MSKASQNFSTISLSDTAVIFLHCDIQFPVQLIFNPKLEADKPRFKSKYGKQSSYHCMSVSVGDGWIKIPKCSKIKAKVHRQITGKVKSITISKTTTGKYFASSLVEDGLP